MKKGLFILLLGMLSLHLFAADIPGSFQTAKKVAHTKVYKNKSDRQSFYCGCSYNQRKFVNSKSCPYEPSSKPKSKKCGREHDQKHCIEWEHVTPAAQMGRHLACWQQPEEFPECGDDVDGRDCCQAVDQTFRDAHNDLVNLVPSVGALNRARLDDLFGILEGEEYEFGGCDFESPDDITEPRELVRGDIARIHLYMIDTYAPILGFEYEEDYMQMLYEWAEQDPVSQWEVKINNRICEAQGQGNEYVSVCPE